MPTRIVNGKRIRCSRAPYQCALHYQGSFICGCVILSRRWILTAHHCFIGGPGAYSVRAGSAQQRRGGQLRRVQKIVAHGGYSEYTMNNDLAMMKLRSPLKYNRCVRNVRLPGRRSRRRLPRCCLASGWGLTSANAQNVQRYLRGVMVCRVRRRRCVRNYRSAGIRITRHMICYARRNRDTCSGDSGGPLVHNNVLYGITSFGIGCARSRYPGVYVDVGDYVKWIKRVGGAVREVERVVLHPGFKLRTLDNDIALLKTKEPFQLEDNVQLVKLPLPGLNILPRTLLVAGWGTINANVSDTEPTLRGTFVDVIDQRRCQRLYARLGRPIKANMLCAAAAGRDHCYGDSGAPLVHHGSSYGIVSFAHGCADPRFPGVYTRLANYVTWILNVLNN
ncbi:hypothetical protein KR038_010400 [Drosophila bunnanda]|nr:hypothetical protein KR038_010400 [Drosophila bunnanda]